MKASKRRSTTGQIWLVAGAAMLAFGLLIGASVWSAYVRESGAPVVMPEVEADADLQATGMTMGDPAAKAELVEYGDYL
ncbi:MAG: hypothetical protein ACOY94_20385 [Bacillota bacterium]